MLQLRDEGNETYDGFSERSLSEVAHVLADLRREIAAGHRLQVKR